MKKEIRTEIEIDAPLQKVWEVLLDTEKYSEWNPFIGHVSGKFIEGEKVEITLTPPRSSKFKFTPHVLKASSPEIRWRGKFLVKGIFDGEHQFLLEALSEQRTRFIHSEQFSGLLVGVMSKMLEKTQEGFKQMNEALKVMSEK